MEGGNVVGTLPSFHLRTDVDSISPHSGNKVTFPDLLVNCHFSSLSALWRHFHRVPPEALLLPGIALGLNYVSTAEVPGTFQGIFPAQSLVAAQSDKGSCTVPRKRSRSQDSHARATLPMFRAVGLFMGGKDGKQEKKKRGRRSQGHPGRTETGGGLSGPCCSPAQLSPCSGHPSSAALSHRPNDL